MKVILDSNALLICISKKSIYRPIFDALLANKYELAVSNEVLTEYVEVLTRFTNSTVANNIAELLSVRSNVRKEEIFYRWGLIFSDTDDNKFVDLAIAADVDFIVSNDSHLDVLKEIPFPKVKTIRIKDFLEMVNQM